MEKLKKHNHKSMAHVKEKSSQLVLALVLSFFFSLIQLSQICGGGEGEWDFFLKVFEHAGSPRLAEENSNSRGKS